MEAFKHGPTATGVLDLILKRWSPRAFAETAVSDAELNIIFSAGLWAASSYNEQPWRFVLGRKGDDVWDKIFGALIEANQSWARSVPVLFASFAKKTFSHSGETNRHRFHDVGAACSNMSLQAAALGLHTHGMAGFDSVKLCSALQVPDDFDAVACWALGRLGDPDKLQDVYRTKELTPRSRKQINQVVFGVAWGKPLL